MDNVRRALWIAALIVICCACGGRSTGRDKIPGPLDASDQCVLVLADGWDSTEGVLRLFERSWTGSWKAVGLEIPVFLGRKGLGWGRGLHPEQTEGPRKTEGDGRAPAGIFTLDSAFGRAPLAPQLKTFPFLVVNGQTVCVDDGVSSRYNTVFQADQVPVRNWDSCENMLRSDARYDLGLLVGHNPPPVVPEGGSCIFMHLFSEPPLPTSGCTSMARSDMERLLRHLDTAKRPVLVQLPRAEYGRLKKTWELP
ncbi:L,D-transpeptidase family protein [Desulfovibrio aminophilus]|uniref:L,D-transpeptidase family protein n=1 Tax=Desulfovibrio aminophilus TaxID=81425 RepID=UPI003392DAFB